MRSLFILIIILLLGINSHCQDLSGHWVGELPQDNNTGITLKLEMDIIQNGNALSGKSLCTSSDGHWVKEVFYGNINGAAIIMNEYKADDCNCTDVWKWCLKKMTGSLTLDPVKKLYTIQGMWHSDTSFDGKNYAKADCSPGRFVISKTIPAISSPLVKKTAPLATSLPPVHPYIVKRVTDTPYNRPLDGYYVKSAVKQSVPTTYAPLREADVVFAKRVWREIDLRERMNQYLIAPKGRLIDLLVDAIRNGELTAYDATPNAEKDDPNGDEFSTPLTPDAAMAKMADSTTIHAFDKNTGDDIGAKRVAGQFNPDSILKFRIKEDWIFDKQRSVLEPRIIGIAPLVRPVAAGQTLDYQPAFWIYFPEARKVLATHEIVMRHNDASGISFDQAFLKRIFNSYIVKQSNEKDERIKDYMQGIDQLYESEKIKKTLMDYELNLWQY